MVHPCLLLASRFIRGDEMAAKSQPSLVLRGDGRHGIPAGCTGSRHENFEDVTMLKLLKLLVGLGEMNGWPWAL